jgi:hypothetical protein
VRDYALEHICPVDRQRIQQFIETHGLEEQLKGYTDEQLKHTLDSELQDFAIKQWMKELRISSEIVYADS